LTLATTGTSVPLAVSSGSQSIAVPVTLSNSLAATIASGAAMTISGSVNEAVAGQQLGLTGGGLLVLAGNNGYSGATTVNASTLQIGTGGTGEGLASQTITMTNGATLAFNHADTLAYSGTISGNGSLVKSGSGMLSLSSLNTYQGSTTISAGTVQTNQANGLPNTLPATTALVLGPSGVLDLYGNAQTVASLSSTTGGTIIDTYCDPSHYTIPLTVNPAAGATTFAGNIAESAAATHDLLSLTLSGSGQLTLSGSNTYSGGTTVSGGTLEVTSAQALSSNSALAVSGGGRVVSNDSLTGIALAAAGGDASPSLNLLGSSQWAALAAQARAAQAQPLTSSLDSGAAASGVSLASASPVSYMATLGGAPVLAQVGTGSAVGGLAAVPEPGTLALLLAGSLSGLGLWLKRRK